MKRRDFITLLGGAAAAWPLVARAQQAGSLRRVGVLMNVGENDPEGSARVGAFTQGLRELGWIEGRNVRFDKRWASDDPELTRHYAMELVQSAPEVILASAAASSIREGKAMLSRRSFLNATIGAGADRRGAVRACGNLLGRASSNGHHGDSG
jgi:hypothetical protein